MKKSHNHSACSKACKKIQEKNKTLQNLSNPEYKKKYLERKKESARKDYLKHKERCKENAKKLRYTKNCAFCSKEFKAYVKSAVTCSVECYRKRMSENRK